MSFQGVGSTGSAPDIYASLPAGSGSSSSPGGLSQSDFLQMLVSELENQNPLSPMSTSDYVDQMSTLSEVSAIEEMTQGLSSLFALTSSEAATGLLGQTVTVTPQGGTAVTGTVTGITASASGPLLTIGGSSYALSDVTQVTTGAGSSAAGASPAAAGGSGVPGGATP